MMGCCEVVSVTRVADRVRWSRWGCCVARMLSAAVGCGAASGWVRCAGSAVSVVTRVGVVRVSLTVVVRDEVSA